MVDYTTIRTQLRQRQRELGSQQITKIPQMKLRMGIQGLPQRKEVAHFNKRLREQSRAYEKQIKAIDKYLLLKAKQDKIISELGEDKISISTFSEIPKPSVKFSIDPKLKKLRNKFNRRKKFL